MWYSVRCFMQHFHSVYERILKAGFDVDFYEVKHLPYVFFLRAIAENATKIARSYSYLHFWKKREGSRVSLVPMDDEAMRMLQIVATLDDPDTAYKEAGCLDHLSGKRVEVIAGPYAGVKGKRCHVKNKRHVVFNVPGVCTVCTPYIPTEFLREII